MINEGDKVTTDKGGAGVAHEVDSAHFRVLWIIEPEEGWRRVFPIRLTKTKLWKLLYEV